MRCARVHCGMCKTLLKGVCGTAKELNGESKKVIK